MTERAAHGVNATHDPHLSSWVDSANVAGCDFPIQNLPFGVFRRSGTDEPFRGGVAIGDQILDVAAAARANALIGEAIDVALACGQPTLNAFMARGPHAWSALRAGLSGALRQGAPRTRRLAHCLVPQNEAEHALPARIGDYTDFYTSVHHATNVGRLFRPDNPLLPNYKWVPIGYHGRASTIQVSGHGFPRPVGQTLPPGASTPAFGPSRRMDYELELGIYVGTPNAIGQRIPIGEAERHVFGISLFNDWSARDIQAWEYQPLGPFLSKNFASTLSPWIVTLDALAPFRLPWERPAGDPQPLAYLDSPENRAQGAFDIRMEVWLETEAARCIDGTDGTDGSGGGGGGGAVRLARTSFKHSYWTIAQMVAHHTVNGCALQAGDLLGSGTESGPTAEEAGSLLELSAGGKQPVPLPNGETRTFLEDGDTVILRGYCEKPGSARIGFGECRATLLPALDL